MKKLSKVLIASALLFQSSNIYSQTKPTFEGTMKIEGNRSLGNDTIQVIYHKPYTPYRTNYETFTIVTDSLGNFSFKLPHYSEPAVMGFWIRTGGRAVTEMARKRYFFENTDTIKVNVQKKASVYSVNFDGNGADKFNVVWDLANLGSPAETNTQLRKGMTKLNLTKPDSLLVKLERFNDLTRRIINKKNAIIKNLISSERIKRMVAYENAPIYFDWKFEMAYLYTVTYKNDPENRSLVKANFNLNNKEFSEEVNEDMSLCPHYLNFLALDQSYSLLLNSSFDTISFKELYNLIVNKYKGLIRERLIANLFLGFSGYITEMKLDNQTLDSLMTDGKKYITIPFVKSIYNSQEKLSIGKNVFNASFKDLKGGTMNLNTLKNKVVFIDMWFTGCGACAKFHQEFYKAYYPLIKANNDFVYLSISLDSSMDKWKQGIETDIYTSKDYLNVYAENGFKHPFPKYYNLGGAPFILLIDRKGKIFANVINGPKDAYTLIKEALKTN